LVLIVSVVLAFVQRRVVALFVKGRSADGALKGVRLTAESTEPNTGRRGCSIVALLAGEAGTFGAMVPARFDRPASLVDLMDDALN
jgi:hypothetical protein